MTHYTMEWRLLASYIDKGWRVGVSRFEKKSHQLNQLSRSVTNNNVLVYGFKKKYLIIPNVKHTDCLFIP